MEHRTSVTMQALLRCLLLLFALISAGCAGRRPIPAGEVPLQESVAAEEEQYGHEVLNALTEKYPIDRDDARINRVRDIVDRLAQGAGATANPWHVHVLVDDDFKNAAATRGNYIFVWTGLLKTAHTDEELATVLAHEMGHVLANHTVPTPEEETSRIVAGAAGIGAREVVLAQGGYYGALAGIAELVVSQAIQAMVLNPEQQRKELEADQIGLFLMADAKYDPDNAVAFWERVAADPDFSGFALEFLSTHPSSHDRIANLRAVLPAAEERYRDALAGRPRRQTSRPLPDRISNEAPEPREAFSRSREVRRPERNGRGEEWVVLDAEAPVREGASDKAPLIESLPSGTRVRVEGVRGRWLEISSPAAGFVRSRHLAPAD